MCLLSNFCCCLSLKSGTITAAIYTLVVCIIHIITNAVAVWKSISNEGITSATGVQLGTFIFVILWFIFAIFIFIAIYKRNRNWLMPWIVIAIVVVVVSIVNIIIIIVEHESNLSSSSQYINFAILIAICFFNIYLVIIVCSYYRRNLGDAISTQTV